jgi:hypothetical protein
MSSVNCPALVTRAVEAPSAVMRACRNENHRSLIEEAVRMRRSGLGA